MYERILSRRSAPKLLAMGIPKPMQMPMQKPSTRNCTLLVAPTAASAPVPSTRPTMAGINQIIHLLQEVAEQKRHRKLQDKLEGLTLCHTFCHENHPKIHSLFSTFLFYHTFFILAMAELRILHVVFHTFCVNCGKSARFAKKGKNDGRKDVSCKTYKRKILTRRSKSIDNEKNGCYNLFNF